ncbi:Protein trichome birefringence-like 5 [Linum perenne]
MKVIRSTHPVLASMLMRLSIAKTMQGPILTISTGAGSLMDAISPFNAADFLERLRGKKLLLVGDSMNRNQFESILCLLREGLPNKTRMFEINGHKITKGRGSYVFKFLDYNCSVEYALSHYLVKEGVRVNGRGNSNPTLSIDKVDKTSKKWKRADIIVFNTGHWWNHRKTSRG